MRVPGGLALLIRTLPYSHRRAVGALVLSRKIPVWGVKMKKLFPLAAALVSVATAASAADFPVAPMKAALPAPILFSWTGCYVGVEGGGAWGQGEQIANSGAFAGQTITGGLSIKGGIAGGTVGCNIQMSNFVVSGEADFSWTNKRGSVNDLPPFNTVAVSETREKWLDTFRGRFGYAIDRFMIYGTAGVALAGTEVRVTNATTFGTLVDSRQRTGWTAGLGGEFAVWTGGAFDVTLKVEYLHVGFETHQYFNPPIPVVGGTVVTRDTKLTDDIVRGGLNVKFNWGPVVARY
jgi:outer membrane immunogenic protein